MSAQRRSPLPSAGEIDRSLQEKHGLDPFRAAPALARLAAAQGVIRRLRRDGLKVRQIAEYASLTPGVVNQFSRGVTAPSSAHVAALEALERRTAP